MLDKKTILIIDDESSQLELLEKMLVEYNVFSGETSDQMWECIHKNSIDLILLDVIMPNEDGFQIAQALSKDEITKDIPVLFISARVEGQDVVNGFKAGGVDYIKKPYDSLELKARIAAALKQKDNELYLIKQSMIDPLTKVYNRQYFTDSVYKQLAYLKRSAKKLSIALVDIDFFKKVNDSYGHQAGDIVLRKFSDIINDSIREYDILARFGGEEFVIMFFDCPKEMALSILSRIKDCVEQTGFKFKKECINITFSAGIADTTDFPNDNLNCNDMLHLADQRMYIAKKAGRNRIKIND